MLEIPICKFHFISTYVYFHDYMFVEDLNLVPNYYVSGESYPAKCFSLMRASKYNIFIIIMSRKIHVSLRAKNEMPSQYVFAKLSLDSLPPRLNYNLLNATLIFCLVLFGIVARRLIFVQNTATCRFNFITQLYICEKFRSCS